jgi:hypothetical protein
MRFAFPAAAAALMLSLSPAFAQTATPPVTAAPAPMTPAPMAPAPTTAAPATPSTPTMAAPKSHKRQTLQQRFDAANTTHDGHLTVGQADAAKWTYVSKHFSVIDKDHKGYVTVDDIKAYSHAARSAKHNVPVGKASPPPATTN